MHTILFPHLLQQHQFQFLLLVPKIQLPQPDILLKPLPPMLKNAAIHLYYSPHSLLLPKAHTKGELKQEIQLYLQMHKYHRYRSILSIQAGQLPIDRASLKIYVYFPHGQYSMAMFLKLEHFAYAISLQDYLEFALLSKQLLLLAFQDHKYRAPVQTTIHQNIIYHTHHSRYLPFQDYNLS